jgi:hypothetical protein
MRTLFWRVVAVVLFLGAAMQACSSSSSGPSNCADNPNSCSAGTTCWPTDCQDPKTCVPKMACLPSAPNKNPHDLCNNTIGTPTCSDHQACVEFQSGRGGCLVYCDSSKPNGSCPEVETCVEVKVGQVEGVPVIHVCAVVEGDGGTTSSGGLDGSVRDVRSELPM